MSLAASEEAAAILIRTFEALARASHKTLSQKTRADLTRACELLARGDSYDELLVDLLEQPPIRNDRVTQAIERESVNSYGDPRFGAWRRQRHEDAQ
jgi:hypothetical protein